MNERTKLLPCPFCGHAKAHVGMHPAPLGAWSYSVQCGWCRGSGGVWIEQPDAIAAWNRRAPVAVGGTVPAVDKSRCEADQQKNAERCEPEVYNRVAQLKCAGNAIVPEVCAIFMMAILRAAQTSRIS